MTALYGNTNHYDEQCIHNLREQTGFPDSFLRLDVVANIFGVSKVTIRDWVKRDEFPRPFKLASRAIGWKRTDIERVFNSVERTW